MPDDVGSRVVAVAVSHRRPVGVERLLLERALHVDDRLERLVLDDDRLERTPCLLRVLDRDDGDRLADVAHAVDRERRLVGELEPVEPSRCTLACVSTAWTPSRPRAALRSIETIRACACGLRSVSPHSMPGAERSLA